MTEKRGIIIGLLITIVVIISLTVWMMNAGTIGITDIGSFAIILIIVGAALYIIWDRAKNIKKGLPVKDERLISINYKAGYYGFIAAIWSATFGSVLFDIITGHALEGHLVTALVVIVAGCTFIVSYLFLAWRGN